MVRIPKIHGGPWLNGEKPEIEGEVILIDFFTYSCVNCLRTIPYLQKLWSKYSEMGLTVIGVHTPEFEFEKDESNVKKALKDLGIEWPVVLDNDLEIWHAFANKYWPAKYLVNQKGKIVYQHFGEGNYKETEKAIQKLLFDRGEAFPELTQEIKSQACFKPTPELYLGYGRGSISNVGGYYFDGISTYETVANTPLHQISLRGPIKSTNESVETVDHNSEMVLHFNATEVNLVIEPVNQDTLGEAPKVKVLFDDQSLPEEIRGTDLDSDSIARISKPRLYNLVKSSTPLEGKLTIKSSSGNFISYAFTFSGCY